MLGVFPFAWRKSGVGRRARGRKMDDSRGSDKLPYTGIKNEGKLGLDQSKTFVLSVKSPRVAERDKSLPPFISEASSSFFFFFLSSFARVHASYWSPEAMASHLISLQRGNYLAVWVKCDGRKKKRKKVRPLLSYLSSQCYVFIMCAPSFFFTSRSSRTIFFLAL